MNNRSNRQSSSFIRAIKKFFLSAFVVVSFLAYALENRSAPVTSKVGQAANANGNTQPQTSSSDDGAAAGGATAAQAAPSITPAPSQLIFGPAPTNTPSAAAPNNPAAPNTASGSSGQYKDGTYTGPEVDVNFGLVQVQAVIQNGRIANVQFLEYPTDRRTSQRINNVAVPELQQEAVQAQSANVNLITGATLTSEGFQMSLQDALNQAKQ